MKSIQETFANEVHMMPTMTTKMDLEVFANELVECVQGKSAYEVIYIHSGTFVYIMESKHVCMVKTYSDYLTTPFHLN